MSMLTVESLTKAFGGVRAIDDLSFQIRSGAVHSIIGPNGAGKTTLFNLITGVYQPTSGRILLDGEDLARRSAHQRAWSGMNRTFQNLQVCMNMSALENVMLGEHQHLDHRFLPALLSLPRVRRGEHSCRERSMELMEFVGLAEYIDSDASAMSYGALKRLEIARALAARPRLLLLDEPAAGLNNAETAELERLIRKLDANGITVVLVEHDMKLVMNVSEHIVVLNYGRKLAEGTPREVRENPDVVAAYLGSAANPPGAGAPMPRKGTPVLRIEGVATHYGPIQALEDVSLTVNEGQIVALVGANGAGKTTLLRTISGLRKASAGRVVYQGRDITTLRPAARVAQGIVQVPEGRQMFGPMSVEDNLLLGAHTRPRGKALQADLERMYEMFPILGEKRKLPSATLSGGQQQMLALARALMARPRMLLLDEPSMGLAPLIVAEIFRTIGRLKQEGITILLVEQNAAAALAIADHGYVIENGNIVMSDEGRLLLENEDVKRAYLGI